MKIQRWFNTRSASSGSAASSMAERNTTPKASSDAALGDSAASDEAILVPVLNEEGVIGSFLTELASHAVNRRIYLLDSGSSDATVAEALAVDGLDLQVVSCPRGLATAIRHGVESSCEARLAVIDGDGQHDPRILPTLFAALDAGNDLAVGSRFVTGASVARDWPWYRHLVSVVLLRTVYIGVRCHGVRDPFSGCFALHRNAWARVSNRFDTGGYKFLLDFLSASRTLHVAEMPLKFRARHAGVSKLNFKVFWELLISLAAGVLRSRIPRRWLSFCAVGTLGIATDATLTVALHQWLGLPFILARPLTILAAMTQNYLLNNRLTFTEVEHASGRRLRGWTIYVACQIAGAVANWSVSAVLYSTGLPWPAALLAGVAAGTAINLATALKFVWPGSAARHRERRSDSA